MGNTTNPQPATAQAAHQQAASLGLPTLASKAATVAAGLAKWAAGLAQGRRGITVQGAYLASAAIAQAANGGNAVTPAHVSAMYLALGGVAPGRGNPTGYGARKGYTLMHSAAYGAGKHLTGTGVSHGKGTAQGAATYTVQAPALAIANTVPVTVLAGWAKAANAYLVQYGKVACGCTGAKGKPCGTARKGGGSTFTGPAARKPKPSAPSAPAKGAASTTPAATVPSTVPPSPVPSAQGNSN